METFMAPIFARFSLHPTPTNWPWVSEDGIICTDKNKLGLFQPVTRHWNCNMKDHHYYHSSLLMMNEKRKKTGSNSRLGSLKKILHVLLYAQNIVTNLVRIQHPAGSFTQSCSFCLYLLSSKIKVLQWNHSKLNFSMYSKLEEVPLIDGLTDNSLVNILKLWKWYDLF